MICGIIKNGNGMLKKINVLNKFSTLTNKKIAQHIVPIATRFADNDMQAHINNVMYYSYMDTAINSMFHLDLDEYPRFVVETGLIFHAPASHPDVIDVKFHVEKLGNSSVQYNVSMYSQKKENTLLASGKFVHVYVDPSSHRPVNIPDGHKEIMNRLLASPE
jgi:acyl-CoA thioester hydrolase